MKYLWSIVLVVYCGSVFSESLSDTNMQRAKNHYILFCQGCHGPKGEGSPGHVPRISDFMGNFLHVNGGREFLIQVPGSAYSSLASDQLAELLNWMLLRLSADEVPENFKHYTANEVNELRKQALTEVEEVRAKLIRKMQLQGIDVAENSDVAAHNE